MKKVRLSLALVLALLLWGPLNAGAEERRLVILHTNDLHGFVESYDQGGLERLAYLIEQYRFLYPGEVVLLDAGDFAMGTPLSGTFFGIPTAQVMASLKYDAVALGNHEFDWGQERMKDLAAATGAPVLCANLVSTDGTSEPPYPSYTTVERNGVKLNIVGLVASDTQRRVPHESTEGWLFLEPDQALRLVTPTLPPADALIALNHLGFDDDRKLAQAVSKIDLIVGGHSHTTLFKPHQEAGVPIVQAGSYARYLGVLIVMVDTAKDRLRIEDYKLIPALAAAGVGQEAKAIVERYAGELRPILSRQIANARHAVPKQSDGSSFDTPLGNLVADIFRYQSGTDIALYNRDGVRSSMAAGPLTVGQLHELFPYDDAVTVIQATGEQLQSVVEQGTIEGEGPLSGSGLTATILNNRLEIKVGEQPLERERLYTVATTSFLAGGGDGLASLANLPRVRTLGFTRDVLLQHFEDHPTVESPGSGRFPKP